MQLDSRDATERLLCVCVEVEMLGPYDAWVEVKGYDEFVQWVNQTNVAKAEEEAAARSDSLLAKALAAMQGGAAPR